MTEDKDESTYFSGVERYKQLYFKLKIENEQLRQALNIPLDEKLVAGWWKHEED